jgi:CMP-N-acetylneuraminic acid synthetase
MQRLRVLGLVPARGGSKGVRRKNLRPLAGKPLLQYTAEAARAAERLARVLLSTDDPEIAEVGRRCGLWAPFLRPPDLAADETPMFPVVAHALDWLRGEGEEFDAVCLLQPTSPLRRATDIDACVDRLAESGADCVVSVLPVPARYNPHWVYLAGESGFLRLALGDPEPIARRQDLPPAFHRDGSIYVSRVDVIRRRGSLYGTKALAYPIDPDRSVNLDDESDWRRAEHLLSRARGAGD